jgi:hypothetical protein
MSVGMNIAGIAASLLSRGAATDHSHGRQPRRQPVVRCCFEWSPGGAKDSRKIFRPSGAYRHIGRKPRGLRGLRSVAAPRL